MDSIDGASCDSEAAAQVRDNIAAEVGQAGVDEVGNALFDAPCDDTEQQRQQQQLPPDPNAEFLSFVQDNQDIVATLLTEEGGTPAGEPTATEVFKLFTSGGQLTTAERAESSDATAGFATVECVAPTPF